MQSLFPSSAEVFTGYFFQSPLLAVATLLKVAYLYGCICSQKALSRNLHLPDDDQRNQNIAAPSMYYEMVPDLS